MHQRRPANGATNGGRWGGGTARAGDGWPSGGKGAPFERATRQSFRLGRWLRARAVVFGIAVKGASGWCGCGHCGEAACGRRAPRGEGPRLVARIAHERGPSPPAVTPAPLSLFAPRRGGGRQDSPRAAERRVRTRSGEWATRR
eukprot:gene5895-9215_t